MKIDSGRRSERSKRKEKKWKKKKRKDSISFHFASNERIGARYEDASRRRNLVGKHFEESQIRLSYG